MKNIRMVLFQTIFLLQIHCKEHGIPGLIVEHAFLSNGSDVNNFLKTESGLKSLELQTLQGLQDISDCKKWE